MSQALNIFRKDVRHFWIEICASLLAVSAYAWRVLATWGDSQSRMNLPGFFSGLLTALGPISWCLLVSRVIHDESLVGDRQFWITRPYGWKKLLAAKALFVGIFVNLPLFICNVIFLKNAGFSPIQHLLGLLWIQVLILIFLVLPVASVSVVTSTLVQLLLWTLGIAAYIASVAGLSTLLPQSDPSLPSDNSDTIWLPLFLAICLGIVLWQYSQRKAWIPRVVIVVMGVFLAAGSLIPTPKAEIERAYPPLVAGEQPPFHLVASSPDRRHTVDDSAIEPKNVELTMLFHESAVAKGSLVLITATRVAIRMPNGDAWTSRWQAGSVEVWPGDGTISIASSVNRGFFEKSRLVPAKVDVTFAYTEYHEADSRQIVVQAGMFHVDGVGICWANSPDNRYWNRDYLDCQSPLKSSKTMAHFETSASTCPQAHGETKVAPLTRYAANLNDEGAAGYLAIIPIRNSYLSFSAPERNDDKFKIPGLCAGTQITIGDPVVARTASTQISLDGVNLSDYLRRGGDLIGQQ